MQIKIKDSKEPVGFGVTFADGAFQTFRYILNSRLSFMVVNPYGDARHAPIFSTFDHAMSHACADVENQHAAFRRMNLS